MPAKGEVIVEFFGIPRQRAGRASLSVAARTVAEALAAVESACPRLRGLTNPAGQLAAHYLLSLNGESFVSQLDHPVGPQDRLLLLSADVGG